MNIKSSLFFSRKFFPIFVTQFTSAFINNIFKCTLGFYFIYKADKTLGLTGEALLSVASGIFILPFILFSQIAGGLADKYEKSRLIQILKLSELFLVILAISSIYFENVKLMLATLFMFGIQASIFGPIKYSILPFHLNEKELIAGNGWVESGTFIAILFGTIMGGLCDLVKHKFFISSILLIANLIGLYSCFFINRTAFNKNDIVIDYNIFSHDIFKIVKSNKALFLSILGISWFWMIGGMFVTQLPNYTKNNLGSNEHVATLLFAIFSIGISIGSISCSKLMKDKINCNYIPIATLLMSLFTFDLANISCDPNIILNNIHDFILSYTGIRITFDLIVISISGGLYIVPLYIIMQTYSSEEYRSRTIAANNQLNTLFIFIFSISSALLIKFGYSINDIFLITASLNFIVFLYMCKLLPEKTIKLLLRKLLKLFYKVELVGIENFNKIEGKVLIVANHTSYLDAVLISSFLPGNLTFAINTLVAEKFWIKPFLFLVKYLKIDPANPMAAKSLIKALEVNEKCVIFPEGRITLTGSMMKIYEGPAVIAYRANSPILPICIEGALYSPFSKVKGKIKIRVFPKIKITIFPYQMLEIDEDLSTKDKRYQLGVRLYDIMVITSFKAIDNNKTLYEKLLESKNIAGGKYKVIEDVARMPLSYNKLILKTVTLGRYLSQNYKDNYIGILLPNMSSTIVTFFALQAFDKVSVMINYSSGISNMIIACKTVELKNIITSKVFIEKAKLTDFISQAIDEGINIIYLEDIKNSINLIDKLYGVLISTFPKFYYKLSNKFNEQRANNPSIILFTSGSEGTAKAVILSHKNILTNKSQLLSRIDFSSNDIVFNSLPMFHSFGLTGGAMMPILSGIKVFFYPTPLHYRIIPEMVYDTNATILFGTDSFLSNYAKYASPYDFYSVRYVFAGAEKLREKTYYNWLDKFGIKIFEGYGATETSPVIAANTPMHNKFGTVGRMIPGIEYKLTKVEGVDYGGKLLVKGDNIMLGYMHYDRPGVIEKAKDFYDTGDIVNLDKEGYVTISGRVKRFAKIAGEMISLGAVESYIEKLWSNYIHAIITLPDEKKGEQIILVTTNINAEKNQIINFFKSEKLAEIMIPKKIVYIEKLPFLGSGKIDYVKLKNILSEG